MSIRGQGVVQIIDENKSISNADDYISSFDERFSSILAQCGFIKKHIGKVVSVSNDNTSAYVSMAGYDTNSTSFLNKTGEMLKSGDYVKIECNNEDLTSGYISEKFGVSSIENLNNLQTSNKGSLVEALNSILTFVNNQQKAVLANAITLKGVPTNYTDSFATMAENIKKIEVFKDYFHLYTANKSSFSIVMSGLNLYSEELETIYGYQGDGVLEYTFSLSSTWTLWDGANWLTTNTGNIYLRVSNGTYFTKNLIKEGIFSHMFNAGGIRFQGIERICCDGQLETLLDYKKVKNSQTLTIPDGCFANAFGNAYPLIDTPLVLNPPELDFSQIKISSNTMSYLCFGFLFYSAKIVKPPNKLPATTLADYCYEAMFVSCTSLTTAPELPATTLANRCYDSMFNGCTSLTTAPNLPATTLADECYYGMFWNCTSLTTAPELPATTLANRCYDSMFVSCASLTTTPNLPATTLADECYRYMFWDCTSLTTAPELSATTLANRCCYRMFNGCTSLTTVPSELPATTLADECYRYMFWDCTSLTTAPNLPATTLANRCYCGMFDGCTSLNYIKLLYTGTLQTTYNAFAHWVRDVSATGDFYYNGTDTTTGISSIPAGWTVHTF